MHRALTSVALVCVAFFYAFSAQAMVRVDQRFNQAFQLDEYSCLSFQINFPQNQGMPYRDRTGQCYMRLPAANPMAEAYFAAWSDQLVLLNINAPGPQVIGLCQQQAAMPAPPQPRMHNLQPSNYQVVGAPQGAATSCLRLQLGSTRQRLTVSR